jgi:hypothetical protein
MVLKPRGYITCSYSITDIRKELSTMGTQKLFFIFLNFYLIDTSPSIYDEHWRPASLYCSICAANYNYILHFENIEQVNNTKYCTIYQRKDIEHRAGKAAGLANWKKMTRPGEFCW